MANSSYNWKGSFSLEQVLSSLQNLKSEAAQTDKILEGLGDGTSLGKLVKQFTQLNNSISALRANTNSLKSDLGKSLQGGYISSLDQAIDKLTTLSELSQTVFQGINDVDLKNKSAPKQLEQYAKQLNLLFSNLGIDTKIDLELFNKKDIQAKYSELLNFAKKLNEQINITLGDIDGGKIKTEIERSFAGIGDSAEKELSQVSAATKKVISDLEKQNQALEKTKTKLKEIAQEKKSGQALEISSEDLTTGSVQQLLGEFDALQEKLKSGSKSSIEYYNNLQRLGEVSLKIQSVFKAIKGNDTLKTAFLNAPGMIGDSSLWASLSKYSATKSGGIFDQIANDKTIKNIDSIINNNLKQINFLEHGYEQLTEKVNKYYDVLQKRNKYNEDDDEFWEQDEKLEKIEEDIQSMTKLDDIQIESIEDIFANIRDGALDAKGAIQELCDVLKVDVQGSNVESVSTDVQKELNAVKRETMKQQKQPTDIGTAERQIAANEELAASYEKVGEAKKEASTTQGQDADVSNTEKQIAANEKLADSYKQVEKVKETSQQPSSYSRQKFKETETYSNLVKRINDAIGGNPTAKKAKSNIAFPKWGSDKFLDKILHFDPEEAAARDDPFLRNLYLSSYDQKSEALNNIVRYYNSIDKGFSHSRIGLDVLYALAENYKHDPFAAESSLKSNLDFAFEQFNSGANYQQIIASLIKRKSLSEDLFKRKNEQYNLDNKLYSLVEDVQSNRKTINDAAAEFGQHYQFYKTLNEEESFDYKNNQWYKFIETDEGKSLSDRLKKDIQSGKKTYYEATSEFVKARENYRDWDYEFQIKTNNPDRYADGFTRDFLKTEEGATLLDSLKRDIQSGKKTSREAYEKLERTAIDKFQFENMTTDSGKMFDEYGMRDFVKTEEGATLLDSLKKDIQAGKKTYGEAYHEIYSAVKGKDFLDSLISSTDEVFMDLEKKDAFIESIEKKIKEKKSASQQQEQANDTGAIEQQVAANEELIESYKEVEQAQKVADTNKQTSEFDKNNEVVEMQGTAKNIGTSFDEVGSKINAVEEKANSLQKSIQNVFTSASQLEFDVMKGKTDGKEYMNLFGADGTVSTVEGIGSKVDTDAIVGQMVANLKQNMVMSLHNHAHGTDFFSPADIESYAKLYYGQGTKLNGIVANGIVRTIDFSGISQEVAVKISESYAENLKEVTSKVPKIFKQNVDNIELSDEVKNLEVTNPKKYAAIISEVNELMHSALSKAITTNGVNPDSILGTFQESELPKLSEQLLQIQQNGQNALSPIEKLKNLLNALYPDKSFNWSDYTGIFDQFEKGAIDGTEAINQILNLKTVAADAETVSSSMNTVGASVDQAKAKFQEFIALTQKIQGEQYLSDIDIGKSTANLDAMKSELQELAAQGQLTEQEMNNIASAYDKTKSHLDLLEDNNYNIQTENRRLADREIGQMQETVDEAERNARQAQEEAERLATENAAKEQQIQSLQNQLNNEQKSDDSTLVTQKLTAEGEQLDILKGKLEAIKGEVEAITSAFNGEAGTVTNAVDSEVQALDRLIPNEGNKTTPTGAKITRNDLNAQKYKNELSGLANSLKKSFGELDFSLATDNLSPEQSKIKSQYLEVIALIDLLKSNIKEVSSDQVASTQSIVSALTTEINAYKERNNIVEKSAQKKNNSFGDTALINAQAKYNSIVKQLGYDASSKQINNNLFANSSVVQSQLDKYISAYQKLVSMKKQLANSDVISVEDKAAFKNLQTECNDAARALEQIIKATNKLDSEGIGKRILGKDFDASDIKQVRAELEDFVNELHGGKAANFEFNASAQKLTYTVNNGDGTFTKFTASLNAAKNAIVSTAQGTEKATSTFGKFFNSLKSKVKSISTYLISMMGIQEVFQQIRRGIQYVRDIDGALTELKKVTDETDATYARFLQTASKTASVIGTNVADFTNATADFARLGYSLDEASKLAEAASVYKNVGDGITDVSEASESIISTMKAFDIEATNSMEIVDKFNEIGNNFAISSVGIGDALQRSASALFEAGNDIDQSIGLITAANSVVQDPEQVGTALKTLSLRLRGAKADLEDAGLETDNMCDSVSTLREKLLALTGGKADIMIDDNTFKSTTDIIGEMSKAWDSMTDINRSAALELMGGKRQANILASLIKNYDVVEDVIKQAADASGSALAENEKYLDSIQGKIDQFTNALQTMWMDLLDSSFIKEIVNIGTVLIQIFDKIQTSLGTIPTILAAIVAYNLGKVIFSWISSSIKLSVATSALTAAEATLAKAKDATAKASAEKAVAQAAETKATLENTQANLQNVMSLKSIWAGLKTFLKSPLGIASMITAGVSIVVSVIKNIKEAQEEAAESAKQQASEVSTLNNELKDYQDQIASLRAELDTGNLSEEEAYDVRKKLISIQDELISRYGKEAEGINLVTGAIENQISAINDLAVANAQDWLNENNKKTGFLNLGKSAIQQAKDAVTNPIELAVNNLPDWNKYFKDAFGDNWETESDKARAELKDFINELGGYLGSGGFSFVNISRDELIENFDKISQWLRDYEKKTGGKLDFDKLIGDIESDKIELVGENYNTHKANFDAYLENTAISTYTKEYDAILKAQDKFEEAYASGNYEAIQEANQQLQSAIEAAKDAASEDEWQVNWFDGLDDQYEQAMSEINLKQDIETGVDIVVDDKNINMKDLAESVQKEFSDQGLAISDILNIRDLIEAENNGKNVDWGTYTEEQRETYASLASAAKNYGLEVEDLLNILNKLGYVKIPTQAVDGTITKVKSISVLSDEFDKYNEVLSQTNEFTVNGIEVTQDYKDSLTELGISTEDLNECFDESNPLIIKNADALNRLVKTSKKSITNNARLAKTQAQLQYRDLYKEIKKLTNGTKVTDAATLNYINSLYDQINGLEKTIAKYSMLESKLLGVTNAYNKLSDAQATDEEMDYASKAEELINILGDAFNTGELGTEAAQVAFEGLIPDELIDKTKTLDEQMSQAYEYFSNGPLTQLFTIEYDDNGAISSIEMTQENIEGFVDYLLSTDKDLGNGVIGKVFEGSWDEFNLNPAITNIEDFAHAIGTTEEVAFAFLTSLEKYDISWLGGDFSTLLDQLMGEDLEYQLYDKMQKLSDLEMKIANGTITSDEQKTYGTLVNDMDALEKQALSNAIAWSEANSALEDTKSKMIDLNEQLADTEEGSDAYKKIQNELEDCQEEANKLIKDMEEVGEPTEFTLEVAADEAQEQIDEFKSNLDELVKNNDKNAIEIQAVVDEIDEDGIEELGLTKNSDGTWSGLANIKGYSSLDKTSKAKVVEYLDLIDSQHIIDALMGDGITTVEQHLQNIADILQKTYELQVEANVNKDEVTSFIDWLKNTPISKTISFYASKVGSWLGLGGDNEVNGTAHAYGTAHASGNWGLPKSEHNALVGELGQELVVDPYSGKYYTVGDNGAEMVDLPKNAIVFNHKQTKDLLSHGYAVGRGKAYAKGNAYVNTWTSGTTPSKSKGNSSSSSSSSEDKETFDFIEIKMEEIENLIEKITAKIALFLDDTSDINKKDNYYDQLVEAEKNKASTYLSAAEIYNNKAAELLKDVPEKYRDIAKNGAIAIEDFVGEDEQKTIDAINDYREWAQKADEAEVGHLEAVAQAAAYRVEQLDDIATDFENLTNQIETQAGLVQSHIDLIEESGNIVSEKFYKDLMKKTKEQRSELVREKQSLQKILDDAVKSGDVTVGTDEWFEMVQAIYDVDDAIVQCDIDLEGYQNSINELSWESFERLVDQLDNIDSELSFISDLMSKNDWEVVDEDANWTDKGITALGMYAQQMEIAQTKSQQYGEEIKELKKLRDKGLVSETEYIEKLAELKDGQMDAINAYEDAKDAIVDLNKVRIEAVKEGLQDELDAYQELIEKKKEALDADKDLYDFEKNVAEQQKEIATIQRKIAALSGDNSLSATAQRRKLEAELLEAQADLEDTYRDRSYDNTIDALDKESEAYEESINNQIEELDKSLENIDAIVTESLATVRANTDTVLAELVDLSKTYGIELSKEITSPWADGEAAISAYSESFKNLKDSFAEELNYLIEQEKILQKEADKAAQSVINSLSKNESTVEGATNPDSSKKDYQSPTQYGGAISADGIVGPNTKKKFKTAGYAKGTLGTKKDELALIDELGEELVMHAGPDGKLMFLSKGSSVIPSNITENLMKIGQLDPTEVLKRSTPSIGVPHITNNNIEVNMQIAEVVHIDEVTNETIPDLTKAVEKQMDKYMKNLNGQIRKYAR